MNDEGFRLQLDITEQRGGTRRMIAKLSTSDDLYESICNDDKAVLDGVQIFLMKCHLKDFVG